MWNCSIQLMELKLDCLEQPPGNRFSCMCVCVTTHHLTETMLTYLYFMDPAGSMQIQHDLCSTISAFTHEDLCNDEDPGIAYLTPTWHGTWSSTWKIKGKLLKDGWKGTTIKFAIFSNISDSFWDWHTIGENNAIILNLTEDGVLSSEEIKAHDYHQCHINSLSNDLKSKCEITITNISSYSWYKRLTYLTDKLRNTETGHLQDIT